MKKCKPHGLEVVSGYFCPKCVESLKGQKAVLDKFFNSPKVIKAINSL